MAARRRLVRRATRPDSGSARLAGRARRWSPRLVVSTVLDRAAARRARPPSRARRRLRHRRAVPARAGGVARGAPSPSAWAAGSSAAVAAGRREAPPAAPPAGRPRRRAPPAPSSACRGRAVAGPRRRLLPDRHRAGRARRSTRTSGSCGSTGWSTGRSRSPTGPGRPPAHRGLGDALLRLEPGRRRPDRQRLVERGADRRPARARPGSAPGADAVLADLPRRLDLRHAARGAHRRPQRDAGRGDERRAAADRARLPGADGGARALRLRVGHQVGGRPGGDQVRPSSRRTGPSAAGRSRGRSRPSPGSRCPGNGASVRAGTVRVGGTPGRSTPASRRWSSAWTADAWQQAELGRRARQRHLGAVGRQRST